MTEVQRQLIKSNELLRSAMNIAERDGEDTNWEAWRNQLREALTAQLSLINHLNDQDAIS